MVNLQNLITNIAREQAFLMQSLRPNKVYFHKYDRKKAPVVNERILTVEFSRADRPASVSDCAGNSEMRPDQPG
jgi:hypothetical protein